MRFSPLVPVVLCSTVALAGCGSSSLLDGNSAEDLQASIERVKGAVDEGRCDEALSAATEGRSRVNDLPTSVDSRLRSRLRQGFRELEEQIPTDCAPRVTTTTEPPPVTTTTETTTTEPPPVTTTEVEPAPTTTETTPTTPPETVPEDEVPLGDEESGGTPPVDPEGGEEIDPATPRGLRELQQGMRELRESGREARKTAREARKQFDEAVRTAGRALRGDR
jgi:hypothetical protein